MAVTAAYLTATTKLISMDHRYDNRRTQSQMKRRSPSVLEAGLDLGAGYVAGNELFDLTSVDKALVVGQTSQVDSVKRRLS